MAKSDALIHRQADRLLVLTARRGSWWLVLFVLAVLVGAGGAMLFPAAVAYSIDTVLRGDDLRFPLVLIAVVVVSLAAGEMLGGLAAALVTARTANWLRRRVLDHVIAMGAPAARRFTPGDLVSRMVNSTAQTASAGLVLVQTVAALARSVGGIVLLALIDVRLAGVFLLGTPLAVLIARAFLRRSSTVVNGYLTTQAAIASRFVEAVRGLRTISVSGKADSEVRRILTPLRALREYGRLAWASESRAAWQGALLLPLVEIAVLTVAGFQVAAGALEPGQMVAASGYVALGLGITSQPAMLMGLARARAAARQLAEVLVEPRMPSGERDLPEGPGQLAFQGVGVRREGRPVLDGIELLVPGGSVVAVVGRSGSGKSAMAAVAGRLLDPDEGQVLLDGVPLDQLRPGVLRDAVAYAFERPVLLGDTVGDAIVFGQETTPLNDASNEASDGVVAAARAACAHEFVSRLPHGYQTALTETPMSGGEAQRLGLARAFSRSPRLLVMDDATSSVDSVADARISGALSGGVRRSTCLMITHRMATASRADLVVWLDECRIRRVAPHRELCRDPDYRALFQPDDASVVSASTLTREPATRTVEMLT